MVRLLPVRQLTIAVVVALMINCTVIGDAFGMARSLNSTNRNATGSPWSTVTRPTIDTTKSNVLAGVAAASASNVWAVGYSCCGPLTTLTERWNGTSWSIVPSPNAGVNSLLLGVAAVSASNVWAVGKYTLSSGTGQTLIEHWNGSKWSVVTSPNIGTGDNELLSITTVSASNIWAVGDDTFQTLIEHWNGSKWSVVTSPNTGDGSNYLYGVNAVSASDIWAVGYYIISGTYKTLIENYNGSSWAIVSSPNGSGSVKNYLSGVAAVSASNVWAVGDYITGTGQVETLTERWNGTSWSIVSSPNAGVGNYLSGVAAVSASNVWAVGEYYPSSIGQNIQPLIERWNGSTWSVVTSPNTGGGSQLYGVAAVSAGNVWAVGYYSDIATSGINQPLIEHWNGSIWRVWATVPNIAWSGYAASGSPYPDPSLPTQLLYSDIKGSWQVPSASCPKGQPSSEAAFWVGLGGASGGLEQIGILIKCDGSTGIISYDAVYEIITNIPGKVVFIKDKNPGDVVNPNDQISAEVKYLGGGQYKLFMTDSTPSTSWSFTSSKLSGSAVDGAHDAADWIAEAPSDPSVQPLTNFGTVNFSNCQVDGKSIISNGLTINQFVMTVGGSPTGSIKAVPSLLDSTSTAFSVKWISSGP